jgi:hypothetical protein
VSTVAVRKIAVLLAAVHPADRALLQQEVPAAWQAEIAQLAPLWRRRFAAIGFPRVGELIGHEPEVERTEPPLGSIDSTKRVRSVSQAALAAALHDAPSWLDDAVRSALTGPARARKIAPATHALLERLVLDAAGDRADGAR